MFRKAKTISLLTEITAALFVLLFLYTALDKLKNHAFFVGQLRHNPLLVSLAGFLSWAVPFTELVIVALLIIPSRRRLALLLSGVLMLIFTTYVAYMLFSGSELPCTCGGIISDLTWKQHLFVNTLFTIAAFISFWIYPYRPELVAGTAEHL
jgi:hypothetical protein